MKYLWMVLLIVIACRTSGTNSGTTTPAEVRGVWLTNVDSDVLKSHANIAEAMRFLASHNFNLVCPVVWNGGWTLYRSAIMDSLFGRSVHPDYSGRDPLREVIEEAHKQGLEVYAWFEYGLASSYQKGGGHIIERFPQWAAKDRHGKLLIKNGFEWLNGYHPEVRTFITELVTEVVRTYDVDGIQGDDRLPAQPVEGGYEPYTIERYKKDHDGEEPPDNPNDPGWMRWRAERLNQLAERIYNEAKAVNPDIVVSWAPSVYPWSYEQYLQDWPTWLRKGYADVVIPQHYRHTFAEYRDVLYSQRYDALKLEASEMNRIYPGLLLSVGDYLMAEDYILKAVRLNRKEGIQGEVYFFYEGLRRQDDARAKILRDSVYIQKAIMPTLLKK